MPTPLLYHDMLPSIEILNSEFDRFVQRCGGMIADDLRSKISISDMMQEALYQVHLNRDRLDRMDEPALRAWFQAALRNIVVDNVRRFREAGKRAVGREEPQTPAGVADREPPALDALVLREKQSAIAEAFDALDADERELIRQRLHERLEFDTIAERCGKNVAAVRKAYSRAMERWRGLVSRLYGSV